MYFCEYSAELSKIGHVLKTKVLQKMNLSENVNKKEAPNYIIKSNSQGGDFNI